MSVDEVFDAAYTVRMCVDFLQTCTRSPDALRNFIPRLFMAKRKLREVPAELLEAAAALHSVEPVRMGERAASSYLAMTLNVANEWAVAISWVGDPAAKLAAAHFGDPYALGIAIADGVIANPQEWWDRARAIPVSNNALLHEGLTKEKKALSPGAIQDSWGKVNDDAPGKPVWDRDTGELTIHGKIAKRIRNIGQAKNVVSILNAFQESGWPVKLDDPLPGASEQKRRDRLANAVKSLNDNLVGMRFVRDGSTEAIRWERAPSPDAPLTVP